MYKVLFTLLIVMAGSVNASGQEFNYEYHRSMADSLAKLGLYTAPEIDQQDYELKIREEKIKREKLGWLSSFNMGVQFLSVSQDYNQGVTNIGILPTLGVSLQIDFERFFTTPSRIRSARLESSIILLEKQRLIKVRESQVTSAYFDYVLLIEQTRSRFTTLQTVKEQLKLIEERFRNGETDLETYLNTVTAVDNAREAFYETKIAAEKTLALIENDLEIKLGDQQ